MMKTIGRLAALGVLVYLWTGCAGRNAAIEIPEGYKGWVILEYGRDDCPSQDESLWVSTIRVGSDGKGCSKTWNGTKGFTVMRRYYVDRAGRRVRELKVTGWGEGGEIWAAEGLPVEDKTAFFVGTEEEFKATTTRPRY